MSMCEVLFNHSSVTIKMSIKEDQVAASIMDVLMIRGIVISGFH